METSSFVLCFFLLILFVQISSFPFLVNFVLAFLATIGGVFYTVTNTCLLPLEKILMYFYKNKASNSRASDTDNERSSDEDRASASEDFDDEITRKLRELTGLIVKDFILDWYNTVSDDVQFVQQAFEVFEHIFQSLRARAANVDQQKLVRTLLNHLIRHCRCFRQSVECAAVQDKANEDRRKMLVALAYEKLNGHLAMSNLPDSEADHLRSLVAVLLKGLLPTDFVISGTSMYLVRELISRNVLLALIDTLCRPAWINDAIARVLSDDDAAVEGDEGFEEPDDEGDEPEDLTLHDQPPLATEEVGERPCVDFAPPERSAQASDAAIRYSARSDSDLFELNLACRRELPNRASGETSELEVFLGSSDAECIEARGKEPGTAVEEPSLASSQTLGTTSVSSGSVDSLLLLPMDAADGHFEEELPSSRIGDAAETRVKVAANVQKPGEEAEARKTQRFKDQRFFKHVRIPEVTTRGEALDQSSKYSLYKITYCARPPAKKKKIFKPFFGKQDETSSDRNKPDESSSNQPDEVSEPPDDEEYMEFQAYRRFREFLNLQDRLNENKALCKLVQNVRGPSRMFPMPIGNMDQDYVEKRRKFLQAYLRELCIHIAVCRSSEMREFLGYDSDTRLEFVRRPSELIPRFDKIFKNAFHEIMGSAAKLTEAFAPDDSDRFYVREPSATQRPTLATSKSLPQFPAEADSRPAPLPHSRAQTLGSASPSPVERFRKVVLGKSAVPVDGSQRDYAPFSIGHVTFNRQWRGPDNLLRDRSGFCQSTSSRRTQGDGCDVTSDGDGGAGSFGDCIVAGQLFRLTRMVWGFSLGVNTLSFVSLARFVTDYVTMRLNDLLAKDKWVLYLSTLRNSLWPGGKWGGASVCQDPAETYFDEAKKALEAALPDALRLVAGQVPYERGVADLLSSFQDPIVNRHLVYQLLDTAVKLLFPDLQILLSCRNNVSL